MADTETSTGTIVQSWVSPQFARELKELADADGRSVSNLIRVILEENLARDGGATARGGGHSTFLAPSAGAGQDQIKRDEQATAHERAEQGGEG